MITIAAPLKPMESFIVGDIILADNWESAQQLTKAFQLRWALVPIGKVSLWVITIAAALNPIIKSYIVGALAHWATGPRQLPSQQ